MAGGLHLRPRKIVIDRRSRLYVDYVASRCPQLISYTDYTLHIQHGIEVVVTPWALGGSPRAWAGRACRLDAPVVQLPWPEHLHLKLAAMLDIQYQLNVVFLNNLYIGHRVLKKQSSWHK